MATTLPDAPPLLRPGLATRLRAAGVARSYQDLCAVERPVTVRGRTGGTRAQYDTVARVPCRLTRGFVPAREQDVAAGLTNVTTALVAVAPGTDIRPADRLTITSLQDATLPAVVLEVISAEVRRTTDLEQVITCQLVGQPTPPVVPLST